MGTDDNFFSSVKNNMLTAETTDYFLPNIKEEARMPTLIILIQHSSGNSLASIT